jgi:ribosomal protein L40E
VRAERETELETQRQGEKDTEYKRWHRPEIVGTWGSTVFQCLQCSTLNSLNLQTCRRCSTSLNSAPKVRNPYWRKEEHDRAERETELETQRQGEKDTEYERWHRPGKVGTWGNTVFQCPQCSTLNSLNLQTCRRCSASLNSAPKVGNPYY